MGLNIDKYEIQYRQLLQKYNLNLHQQMNEIFFNENMENITNTYDEQIFNSNTEIQRPRRNSFSDLHYNNFNDAINNRFSTEMSRRNSGGDYGNDQLTSFLPQQNLNNTVLSNNSNMINKQSLSRPSLKLKINIANTEAIYKKRGLSLGSFS